LRTDRKRFNEKLKKLRVWLKENRTLPVKEIMTRINKSLAGHFNYYGVTTNVRSISTFKHEVQKAIFRALNRRSQRRSFNWSEFRYKILNKFPLVAPKICATI
ncbi:MAG: group II intron reverse transcriptase/maturase, partial [Candidatus Moranbacteria bacterium]|nr:group II intron reverse transcriptase/maturase [Candidatus Moranbacteria bacterium]